MELRIFEARGFHPRVRRIPRARLLRASGGCNQTVRSLHMPKIAIKGSTRSVIALSSAMAFSRCSCVRSFLVLQALAVWSRANIREAIMALQ